MMKQIATCLLVALLMTGFLVSGIPVFISYASTDESGSEPSSEDSGSEPANEPEPETEPEPEPEVTPKEPEPEPEPQPKDNTCMGGPPGIDGCPPVAEVPPAEDEGVPDDDCLFHPNLPKCASDNGVCPEGFFQNEDANCVPEHPNGCPEGFHSHEDDETGQCIPNDVPCESGYVLITENKPSCLKKEYACSEYPDAEVCKSDPPCEPGFYLKDDVCHKDIFIFIKKIIKDTKIINKINSVSGDTDIEQTIVAINYDEGQGINCVFGDDNDGQCETFTVTRDSGKEPLLQIIPFT